MSTTLHLQPGASGRPVKTATPIQSSTSVLKSCSGLVDGGVTYQFEGNDEDKRLTYRGMAGRCITLNQINSARDCVFPYLRGANSAALDLMTVNDIFQLGNVDYARRLCLELFEKLSVPVGRKFGNSSGGRLVHLYFWAGSSSINTCTDLSEKPSDTDTNQYDAMR